MYLCMVFQKRLMSGLIRAICQIHSYVKPVPVHSYVKPTLACCASYPRAIIWLAIAMGGTGTALVCPVWDLAVVQIGG